MATSFTVDGFDWTAVINSASTSFNMAWSQQKTTPGFLSVSQGPDSISLSVSPSLTGLTPMNIVFSETRTLAASGSKTYDFTTAGALYDLIGQPLNLSRVFSIGIYSTTGISVLSPGASNGLEWFMGGTSPTITIAEGAGFMFTSPAPATVDGTNKTLTVSSSAGCTYKLVIFGGQ